MLKIYIGIQIHGMQHTRSQRLALHLENYFGDLRDARGRFQMTDIGFYRPDGTLLCPICIIRIRFGQSCDLYGIAQ